MNQKVRRFYPPKLFESVIKFMEKKYGGGKKHILHKENLFYFFYFNLVGKENLFLIFLLSI